MRVIINTITQNIRSVINIFLSFFSTRIVLEALGEQDFGIYSLISGVVALLGFLSNSMLVSTQRFLSYYNGQGDTYKVCTIFENSLFIHILLALCLLAILFVSEPLIIHSVLSISKNRINTAEIVYYIVSVTIFISFISTPYRALLIAHENIVFICVVDIFDGIIKLCLAYSLYFINYDKLETYSCIILLIMFANFILFAVYTNIQYNEACFIPKLKNVSRKIIFSIAGFTSWTLYSMGCIIGRMQGLAILLNRTFGTVINSAYGISIQVSGSIQYIATSIQNAMSPQIIKAEGRNERNEMLMLSERTCKYSFLLLSLVVIPLVFEMPFVLDLWLKDVPANSVQLSQCMLIASLVDQCTIGLGIANQATGKIKLYSLLLNTLKLLTLPISFIILHYGLSLSFVIYTYILIETLCAVLRLPFLHYTVGLEYRQFSKNVFMRIIIPTICLLLVCYTTKLIIISPLRFIISYIVCTSLFIPTVWFFAMDENEKKTILTLLNKNGKNH